MDDQSNAESTRQSITSYLTVIGADKLIVFLVSVFEASVIKDSRYDDGRLQHARLRIGNSIIMMNESTECYPANISQLHLYVSSADEVYERAISLGGVSVMTPNDRPHGDRMAGVEDPCGNVWWIASSRP